MYKPGCMQKEKDRVQNESVHRREEIGHIIRDLAHVSVCYIKCPTSQNTG